MISMEAITIIAVVNLDWFGKVGGNDEDKEGDCDGDKDAVVIGKTFADDGEGGTRCVVPSFTANGHASTRKLIRSSKG